MVTQKAKKIKLESLKNGLVRHPISAYWPNMGQDEFALLVSSIDAIGQQEPIIIVKVTESDREQWAIGSEVVWVVLDGWQRARACDKLGAEANCVEYDADVMGDNPIAYVVAVNAARRQLDKTEQAIAMCEMADFRPSGIRDNGTISQWTVTVGKMAETCAVSEAHIRRIKRLVEQNPEAIERIKAGESTVYAEAEPEQTKKVATRRRETAAEAAAVAEAEGAASVDETDDDEYVDYEFTITEDTEDTEDTEEQPPAPAPTPTPAPTVEVDSPPVAQDADLPADDDGSFDLTKVFALPDCPDCVAKDEIIDGLRALIERLTTDAANDAALIATLQEELVKWKETALGMTVVPHDMDIHPGGDNTNDHQPQDTYGLACNYELGEPGDEGVDGVDGPNSLDRTEEAMLAQGFDGYGSTK